MEGCLFCTIVQGQMQSFKVYEDGQFFATLDINPANPGHIILIPKLHVSTLMDMAPEDVAKFFLTARALALALLEYGAEGVNFIYAMGETAGQRSPHMMLHIIPRYKSDAVHLVWDPKKYSQDEFQNIQMKLAEKIKPLQPSQAIPQQPIRQQPQPVQQQPQARQPIPAFQQMPIPQQQRAPFVQSQVTQMQQPQAQQIPQQQFMPQQAPQQAESEIEKVYRLRRKAGGYW